MNYTPTLMPTVACEDCHLRHLPHFQHFGDDQLHTVEHLKLGQHRAERDAVLLRAGEETALLSPAGLSASACCPMDGASFCVSCCPAI